MPAMIPARRCTKCKVLKPLEDFYKHKAYKLGRTTQCKECYKKNLRVYMSSDHMKKYMKGYVAKYMREHCEDDPRFRLWLSSRGNASTKKLEHTIKPKDIPLPTHCKYLGMELDYRCARKRGKKRVQNGPSIDRIDSTKGYTPDNIQIISDLANRMKQEATPEQLIAFAKGILAEHDQPLRLFR